MDALTKVLQRLLTAPELRRRFGERGRRIVEGGYSAEEVVRRTMVVYEMLSR